MCVHSTWVFISSPHLCFHNPCSCSGLRLPLSLEDVPQTERRGRKRERRENTTQYRTVHSLNLWGSQYMTASVLRWCDISYQIDTQELWWMLSYGRGVGCQFMATVFHGLLDAHFNYTTHAKARLECTVELRKYTLLSDSIVECSTKIACKHFCCCIKMVNG